jgi:hypothetical protein
MPITPQRRSERLRRRKDSVLKKAYELAKFCDVDVALILRIRTTGRYITYRSVDLESWPPSTDQTLTSHGDPLTRERAARKEGFPRYPSLRSEVLDGPPTEANLFSHQQATSRVSLGHDFLN